MKDSKKNKVALYLENKNISNVDLSNPELGNPGIGGTQYNFICMPFYYEKYIKDTEFIFFANEISTIPKKFKSYTAKDSVEAYLHAENLECDFFIWRPTEQEDSVKLLETIEFHSLNVLAWMHSSVSKKIDNMLAKSKQVKKYITVSKEQNKEISNYLLLKKSITICNGFDSKNYERSSKLKKDQFLVVYLGSLVPAKGFGLLAKVWKEVLKIVPQAKLCVIGSAKLYDRDAKLGKWEIASEDFESTEIRPYLSDENGDIDPSVDFLGTLGHEKISYLQKAAVGVVNPTAKTENCPGSAIEFQASGTPVVSKKEKGLLDTVMDKETGLLGMTENDLIHNIVYFLKDIDESYTFGKKGILFVKEKFNYDKISQEWCNLFKGIKYIDSNLDEINNFSNFKEMELKKIIKIQREETIKLENILGDLYENIIELNIKNKSYKEQENILQKKYKEISDKENIIKIRDMKISEQENVLQKKYKEISERENIIKIRDMKIFEQESLLQKKYKEISDRENTIKIRDMKISEYESILQQKNQEISYKEDFIKMHDKMISEHENILQQKDQEISKLKNIITIHDKKIFELRAMLEEKNKEMIDKENIISIRDRKILEQESILQEKSNEILNEKNIIMINNKKILEYSQLIRTLNNLVEVKAIQHPIKKYKSYKNMLNSFHKIKRQIKNKKTTQTNEKLQNSVVHNGCLVYDKDWQYPAITEQHAYIMMKDKTMPHDTIYIAFPWATLIDKIDKKTGDEQGLLDELKLMSNKISKKTTIITVCQHIKMMNYQYLFTKLGITDVFWTHAIKNQNYFTKYKNISIHAFPLYPVQSIGAVNDNRSKKYLYSFIGARATQWYLTQSRNYIIDLLSSDEKAFVKGRDTWHYNKVVYDHQIEKKIDSSENLINNNSSVEFKEIIKQSIFSLCPSGSGPNSIRLWESIGFGAIPVILADTYLPPGNIELWNEAVVFCEETEDAIKTLPYLLEEMAKDTQLLARKRDAMKQLWMLYGPDCFIYDIQKLILSKSKSFK